MNNIWNSVCIGSSNQPKITESRTSFLGISFCIAYGAVRSGRVLSSFPFLYAQMRGSFNVSFSSCFLVVFYVRLFFLHSIRSRAEAAKLRIDLLLGLEQG